MDIGKLIENSQLIENLNINNLTEEQYEILNCIWIAIRDNDYNELENIKNQFIEANKIEHYDKVIKMAKEINKDYEKFELFRNNDVNDEKKVFLINQIFNNFILVNKGVSIKSLINDEKISDELLDEVSYWLYAAVDYCIANNYDGNKLVLLLAETYKMDKNILEELKTLYNNNIMMLKINYIIKNINN